MLDADAAGAAHSVALSVYVARLRRANGSVGTNDNGK